MSFQTNHQETQSSVWDVQPSIILADHFFILEVYRFLSSEVRAYLPSYETVTIWHLRDLDMGKKTIINCDNVKVIDVPQFEGLTIQDIFNFA